MPHGNQREGPYGPPPIQRELPREMPPYESPPQYWGPPPPPRYPAHASQAPRHPPQRAPPPEYHHHRQHVAPPPPPPHHYPPHHHHYGGGPWRDSPERHYYPRPPPPSHHAAVAQRRDMPPPPHRGSSSHEDHYGASSRPYMPMEHEHYVHAPPPPPPRTPPIQFRPTPKTEQHQPFVTPPAAPKKQQQQSTKTSSSGKKKKGDALSLLAKVSTAMADPDEEAEKQKEAERVAEEHHSPPRTANSPVTMWTPKPSQPSTRSRQITPTHEPHHRYFHQPYPRYAPQQQQPAPYGYGGGYRGADSPPAVISERGSFEDPDHRAFGSPSRPPPSHHEDPHYAPYTYVQQPRLEDKTILRKKFSWKHYPELERFLIANRDEYLRHSALNYTAEQKQYNNWLTERLLEVAARHHYVFCPDDFNFVAVRDRIRCYYKSYVQTARKRGLPLVSSSSAQQPKTQKARVESSPSAMEVTE